MFGSFLSQIAFAQTSIDVLPEQPAKQTMQAVSPDIALAPLTPHTADYKVYYGSIELGDAKYRLPATDSGYYQYFFNSRVSLLMLSDERSLQSDFTIENGTLVPFRFVHQRSGTGSEYSEQTSFAKHQNLIHTIYKKEALKLDYQDLIYEPLMVQLQFRMDVIANKRPLEYKMVKEKEIDGYEFKIVGNETITVDGGTFETVKFEVVRNSKKRQTFFWMAPDLAYLPIRLSHYSKGSKQLDLQLAKYQYDKPLPVIPKLDLVFEQRIFEQHMAQKTLLDINSKEDETTDKETDEKVEINIANDELSAAEIERIKQLVKD
ncbi:DUF3108 domain-containing protein [Shewanella aestuarii]|uniref:DUF3108 domain-containing protein n=2 Tax=Shewanella aestuarii TaxID=1028752 RepID=A0A6G9QQ17_9GAMM|nr:DUF3108 domain-containing protein [Shewanella aestuarii]